MLGLMLATTASISPASAFGVQPTGESPPPSGGDAPTVNSWALSPGGTTAGQPDNPGSRPYLSYDAPPGATLNDTVALLNYGNVQLTFAVYATDAFNDSSGAFDLLPGSKTPRDVGSWVTLPQGHVTVPARSRIDMPITINVPVAASPGDHAGAILAASQVDGTDSGGRKVVLDRRAGSRLYVRVAGPINPVLVIDRVHATYHSKLNPLDGSLDVTYTLRNAGNVRLPAHQRLAVKAPFGLAIDSRTPKDVPELLPGNSLTLHAHFNGVPAVIRATTTVSVTPIAPSGVDPGFKLVPVSRNGAAWAIPWLLIAVVTAAALARQLYKRYQRRRDERRREPGSPRDGSATEFAAVP